MESEESRPTPHSKMRIRPHNPAFSFENVIKSSGSTLAKCLVDLGARDGQMSVRQFSHNEKCMVFRAGMDSTQVVAKVFDKSNPDTVRNFEREINIAGVLSGTGLSPPLLHISEEARLAVFSYQTGRAVSEVLTSENVPIYAEKIGQWLKKFYHYMPKRKAEASWIDYLSRYSELNASYIVDHLSSVPDHYSISYESIARNDMHMSNFLVGGNDTLVGLDFEASAFKPVGWDILLAARVLSLEFPEKTDTIAKNLVVGWGGEVGDLPAAHFENLCKTFVGATA